MFTEVWQFSFSFVFSFFSHHYYYIISVIVVVLSQMQKTKPNKHKQDISIICRWSADLLCHLKPISVDHWRSLIGFIWKEQEMPSLSTHWTSCFTSVSPSRFSKNQSKYQAQIKTKLTCFFCFVFILLLFFWDVFLGGWSVFTTPVWFVACKDKKEAAANRTQRRLMLWHLLK